MKRSLSLRLLVVGLALTVALGGCARRHKEVSGETPFVADEPPAWAVSARGGAKSGTGTRVVTATNAIYAPSTGTVSVSEVNAVVNTTASAIVNASVAVNAVASPAVNSSPVVNAVASRAVNSSPIVNAVASPAVATAAIVNASVTTSPRANLRSHADDEVDRILVDKDQRVMMLIKDGREIRRYQVSLGRNPVGQKERQGDGRTPEGLYEIVLRNDQSRFHRSLRISYPSPEDRARAAARGVSPGGDIMIHGLPNGKGWIGEGQRDFDWTEGCIAVTNEEMDELLRLVKPGTPIEIRA